MVLRRRSVCVTAAGAGTIAQGKRRHRTGVGRDTHRHSIDCYRRNGALRDTCRHQDCRGTSRYAENALDLIGHNDC